MSSTGRIHRFVALGGILASCAVVAWCAATAPTAVPAARLHVLRYSGESEIDVVGLLAAIGQQATTAPGMGRDRFQLRIAGRLERVALPHSGAGPAVEWFALADGVATLHVADRCGQESDRDLTAALRSGFFVTFDRRGRALSVMPPPAAGDLARQVVRGLAATLQWSRPAAGIASWEIAEPHPVGDVVTAYRCYRDDDGVLVAERRRVALPRPAALAGEIEIPYAIEPSGTMIATLDAAGAWTSLRGEESLTVTVRGQVVGRTTERIEIGAPTPGSSSAAELADLDRRYRRRAALGDALPIVDRSGDDDRAAARVTLGDDDAASLQRKLTALPADGAQIGRLMRKLAALFTLEPDASAAFRALLPDLPADSWQLHVVVDALAATRTDQARRELVALLRTLDDGAAREVVLHAIAGCTGPSAEQAATLLELAQGDHSLPATVWLTLGAVARRLDLAAAAEVVQAMRDRLLHGDPAERRHLILGLGNARPADLAATLAPFTRGGSPSLRRAVTIALGSAPSPAAEELLLVMLRGDSDVDVRGGAASALAEQALSVATWDASIDHLSGEPDQQVRRSLLASLWARPIDAARLRSVTRALARLDPSPRVRDAAAELLAR